jgi:hypothetical protein
MPVCAPVCAPRCRTLPLAGWCIIWHRAAFWKNLTDRNRLVSIRKYYRGWFLDEPRKQLRRAWVEVFVEGRTQPALHSIVSPVLRAIPGAAEFVTQHGKAVPCTRELGRRSKKLDAFSKGSFKHPVFLHPVFQDFIHSGDKRLLPQAHGWVVKNPEVTFLLNEKCYDLVHSFLWL